MEPRCVPSLALFTVLHASYTTAWYNVCTVPASTYLCMPVNECIVLVVVLPQTVRQLMITCLVKFD